MDKILELKLLDIVEKLLPKTQYADNKELKNLLKEIRKDLEGDK